MTTIATNGRTMACDGLVVTRSDTIVGLDCVKIARLADGRVVGLAGNACHMPALVAWLDSGRAGDKPDIKGSEVLILAPGGAVSYMDDGLTEIPSARIAALGTGKDHALTAMDMGAPPELAVQLAIDRDPFSGGLITVMSIE